MYAASDESKEIYVWRRGREAPLINLTGISSLVTSLNLNTTDAELVSGLKGGMIIIWDLESSKVKYTLAGHSSSITTINSIKSEDSEISFLSASSDGKIKLWDVRSKNASATIKAHSGPIKALSPSPNGRYLASGSEDGMTRLWDLKANKIVKEFSIQGQGGVNCVEINPYAITLAYGTNDRTIKHWDLEKYSLISVTAYDRTPIIKIKFDLTGKNIFSATNESIKYWMVADEEPKLIYLAEAGWKQLHDINVIEGEGIYAVGTYGNKISYWFLPWDAINSNNSQKNTNSDILSEFNNVKRNFPKKLKSKEEKSSNKNYNSETKYNPDSRSKINNVENGFSSNDVSLIGNINPDLSNFILNDFNNLNNMNHKLHKNKFAHHNSSNIIYKPQNTFIQNDLNIIPFNTKKNSANALVISKSINKLADTNNIEDIDSELILINKNENHTQDEATILKDNNKQNLDISNIYHSNLNMGDNSVIDTSQNEYDILSNLDGLLNDPPEIQEKFNENDVTLRNTAQFDQTINLGDFNISLNLNSNETFHLISQTNDLPLIQEINDKHSNYKNVITQRSNSLKNVAKWWGESNISSTINALKLIKDISVVNDFFKFAFFDREDIEKIYFSYDHALGLLPFINNLISSKYEVYNFTGCRTGMIILRIFNFKISNRHQFSGDDNSIKDDKLKKSNELIQNFDKIFKNTNLKKLIEKTKNNELCKFANSFYTDLEFFLKPYRNKNII